MRLEALGDEFDRSVPAAPAGHTANAGRPGTSSMTRSPLWSVAMSVPQRRQGSPARPYTHSSRPRRVSPVVVRFARNRLAHSICCARVTMRSGSGRRADRPGGSAPEHEAQFVGVHVPDTGHHALIQKCLGKRPLRVGGQVCRRGGRRPVRPQQVRAEMCDGLEIACAVEDLEQPEVNAAGDRRVGDGQDDAYLCAAACTRPNCQLPSIIRCEWMLAGADADEQCLPRLSTSSTRSPDRSTAANRGTRTSHRVRVPPTSRVAKRSAV